MEYWAIIKEGELPLMQQNLSNVENMLPLEKCIFTFDRNYNAMELYARINRNGLLFCSLD